ncbi:hypothetical protein [Halorarius halobius]|uniref:hypothetical protein n=1 Tax=Halorarius halobius TaxID=2962671 RepID=UPI0020CF0A69|nr:hypothetical protein [Halorarius halobius]
MNDFNPTKEGVSQAWTQIRGQVEDASEVEKATVIEQFLALLAKARADGEISDGTIDNLIGSLHNLDSHSVTKTALREIYDERTKAVSNAEVTGEDPATVEIYPLDRLLRERLLTLRIIQSTDTNENAAYQWTFETDDGPVTIETEGSHKSAHHFRGNYFDATAEHVAEPSDGCTPWSDWVERFIMRWKQRDPSIVDISEGPRTQAIEDLRRTVSSMTAVTSQETAYKMELLCLRDEETNDTVRVESRVVQRAIAPHESVSMRALYAEMSAKDYLARKVETTQLGDGTPVRWWCLKRSFAEPAEIETDDEQIGMSEEDDEWDFGETDE